MATSKKKVKLLSELEHVLKRPEMYVSSTIETDETVHYLEETDEGNHVLHARTRSINLGMYKLLWEIFDNAVDEIKRIKAKSKAKAKKKHIIEVILGLHNNRIMIRDNGEGFFQAIKRNTKSKVTNIETAFCFLRSGSNFDNEDVEQALIGMNGVGATLVNMLSDEFQVKSTNSSSKFEQQWQQFSQSGKPHIKKGRFTSTGTSVSFIPRKSIFGNSKFDMNIIMSQFAFRKKCFLMSPEMENTDIMFYVSDGEEKKRIELPTNFFHPDSYVVELENFLMVITPKYQHSDNFLMVNSTQCTGSPTRYIQEILDEEIFKNPKAHNYFNIQLLMNLPPNLVKFGDQNKTKYSIPKNRIAPVVQEAFTHRHSKFLYRFPKSETYQKIMDDMERLVDDKEQKAILKDKKKVRKVSKKYLPASKKPEYLFVVEGDSAGGSISQGRNPQVHGVYQLKGKIQNCRKLADLRTNEEIMELISILDLKFDSPATTYKNIVIATDFDPDGIGHIASLLINFFYRWFPQVVTHNKLYILKVPLVSYGSGKNIKYLYSLKEQQKHKSDPKSIKANERYLKGLGALNAEDWENIFSGMNLVRVKATKKSLDILDMAFGKDSELRKKWLDEVAKDNI